MNQRKIFAETLQKEMRKNDNIWLITGDLGFGIFDSIKNNQTSRFINVGAAEQSMIGIACGLALQGKIPVVYSITPFLLYRPFETIRNYVDREKMPVKLIGAGRDKDYLHDGFSHWAEEDHKVMKIFKNIKSYWPEIEEEISDLVKDILYNKKPTYINLRR